MTVIKFRWYCWFQRKKWRFEGTDDLFRELISVCEIQLSFRLTEDRRTNYFIDDSLVLKSPVTIPDTVENVRILLGDRSSDWGIALHDNLIVYRP